MSTYLNDIEPLENILDKITFEDEPTIFCEIYINEFVETIFHVVDEFIANNPTLITEPDFYDILIYEIKLLFEVQFEDHIINSDYVEDDMDDILKDVIDIYINTFNLERSIDMNECNDNFIHIEDLIIRDVNDEHNNEIIKKIQNLREIPQPVQRTQEWYDFRWGLITASNAWKVFETPSVVNQLIYEKCKPLYNIEDEQNSEIKMINLNSPLHWGQKYEPLSVLLYENIYNSKVEDFGCIRHPKYSFLGASPDGIIVDSSSGRLGRLLEIKNIVNREINGVPKKEYWIQMQLQMEVCDLDECDFLETKFIEYPDYNSYHEDSIISSFDGENFNSYITSKNGSHKGIIIQFNKKNGNVHYEYMPIDLWTPYDVKLWQETTINKYESEEYKYTFLKFIYWKLEKFSCVLVLRNKDWFENNINKIKNVWDIIEKERIDGYEHRAPTKQKRERSNSYNLNKSNEEVCFLKIIKKDH